MYCNRPSAQAHSLARTHPPHSRTHIQRHNLTCASPPLPQLTAATVAPAAAVGCSLSVLHYTTSSAHNQHHAGVAGRTGASDSHANHSDPVTLARREIASAPASFAFEGERDFSGPLGRVELVRTASAAHRLQPPPSAPSSTRRAKRREEHDDAFTVSARRHCGALLLDLF